MCSQPKQTQTTSIAYVSAVQMKNWEPFVLGPALAMDKVPAPAVAPDKEDRLSLEVGG